MPLTPARTPRLLVHLVLLGAMVGTGCAGALEVQRDEDWVARVNGEEIWAADLKAQVDRSIALGAPRPRSELERVFLNNLTNEALFRQAAERAGVAIDPAALRAKVEEYTRRWKTEEAFQEHLDRRRQTLAEVERTLEYRMLIRAIVALETDLSASEAEVREAFEHNRDYYAGGVRVRVSHILVKVPAHASPEAEARALDTIRDAQARLARGEDFAEVAKTHSEGPRASRGGDLMRFFRRVQLGASFADAAFALGVGEVSEPVRTRRGYHLIALTDRREDPKRTLEEVRSDLEERVQMRKFGKARSAMLERLRAAATLEERLPSRAPTPP